MTKEINMYPEQEIIKVGKYKRVYNPENITPFWEDFYKHLQNPKGMNRAEYNLICSKRDISLWTKLKMKPHRNWKVSDAKKYFDIKGSGQELLTDFMEVFNEYQDLKKEISQVAKSGKEIILSE